MQDSEPIDFRPDGAMLALMAKSAVAATWSFCALAFTFAMVMDQAELSKLTSGDYPQVLLRAPQVSGWIAGAFLITLVGMFRIGAAVSKSAGELVVTCLVMTGLMVACCWMSLRCGYLVTPTDVVLRDGELWKADQRLSLDDLVEVHPGCTIWRGKGVRYEPSLVVAFKSGRRVDLGKNVSERRLAKWTEDMGTVSQLPQFRGAQWIPDADAATAKCVGELVSPLDAARRARLLALLGYQ